MVVRTILKKLAVLAFAAALGYLLFLLLFAYSSAKLIRDAKGTYEVFKRDGLTNQVESSYRDLLDQAEHLTGSLKSPLISPILWASGRQKDFNAALNLFDYSKGFLEVAPEFAGYKSPRRYFVAFQNSAEARGTGGLIGAFAVITIDKGRIQVEQVGSNLILQHADKVPVKLPREFFNIYGDDPAMWLNSNMSPHFPYGARIWLALWERQFSEKLDGVITLDPIALSDLLKVTGAIEVRGLPITSENVVAETLSDAYLKFERNNLARKQYLVEIIEGVAKRALYSGLDQTRLLWSLRTSILENRVLLFSTDKEIQSSLRASRFAGVLSLRKSNEFRLVIQNTAGNKMDYYLDREVLITSKSCRKKRLTEVKFSITNSASRQSYLPAYVKGRLDLDLPEGLENSTAVAAFLYGPPGAKLIAAMDQETGKPAGFIKTERNRQALVVPLQLMAGEKRTFVVDFKGGEGPITSYIQPLVRQQITTIDDKCR